MPPKQPPTAPASNPDGHITPRTAIILLFSLLAAGTVFGLLWVGGDHPATAGAFALGSAGVAFFSFDKFIG